VDRREEPITALASLDDKLIVFKSDRIFMILGRGRTRPEGITTSRMRSFVSADTGCAVRKARWWYRWPHVPEPEGSIKLFAGVQMSYIGAEVESLLRFRVRHRAVLIMRHDTRSALCLVMPRWSCMTISLANGVRSLTDYGRVMGFMDAALLYNNAFVGLTSAGVTRQESTAFTDTAIYQCPLRRAGSSCLACKDSSAPGGCWCLGD